MDFDFRPPGANHEPVPAHLNSLSRRIIGCAIEVHKELGPGLLESAYDGALCIALAHDGLQFSRQVGCPIRFRGRTVAEYRLDLIVESEVVIEIKSVERHDPVFVAQMLTYLRSTNLRLGLIINFNVAVLKSGVRRVVR